MIPKIEKLNLKELNLSCGAKKEAAAIISRKQNINGFKFSTFKDKCVAVGRFSGNDFDLWDFAAKVQGMMEKKGRDIPARFRFIFIGD